jgi:hypothetical protein
MISFLSRTIDFFFFFLSLWIYLWLGETSQQPISQTTWLKVTPSVTIVTITFYTLGGGLAEQDSSNKAQFL